MSPNPPAVIKGKPRSYTRRVPLFYASLAVATLTPILMIIANSVFSMSPQATLPGTSLRWMYLPFVVQGIGILGMIYTAIPLVRDIGRLRAEAWCCLNCAFSLPAKDLVCPECGHTQNRGDLNSRWRKYITEPKPTHDRSTS